MRWLSTVSRRPDDGARRSQGRQHYQQGPWDPRPHLAHSSLIQTLREIEPQTRRSRERLTTSPPGQKSYWANRMISTEISTAGTVPLFSSQWVVFLSSGQPTPGP